MTEHYPGYEPAPKRTEEQIIAELNRRTGYVQGVVRVIDPATVASPPAPLEKPAKSSKYPWPKLKRKGDGKFSPSKKGL